MTHPADLSVDQLRQHLSQISTTWTVLLQAHGGPSGAAEEAQRRMIERYSRAIYRYLFGSVRDPDAADELYQEFALRFVRGDFRRASPERGRFRDFLKTALYHLIVDHQRKRGKRGAPLPPDSPDPASDEAQVAESDREFLAVWRADLMDRAWEALARHDQQTGQHLFTVLRFRTDHPDVRSPQIAERLAGVVGKPLTSDWVRKRLFLAREKFTDLLVDEVAGSLAGGTPEDLEQELIDMGLWEYCRGALGRRKTV